MSATLLDLPLRSPAYVLSVQDCQPGDIIARRLREIGFVAGEPVQILAIGPMRREPLLIQLAHSRFALRRAEAARIFVHHGEQE